MRHVLKALLLLSLLVPHAVVAQRHSGTQAPECIKQEIIAREKASFVAWQNRDKAFYADYWGQDMTEFIPYQQNLAHKDEMMAKFDVSVRDWRLDSLEMISPEVRLYGKVAVLTYEENVSGAYKGKLVRYHGQATMIYVKQGGRWRGVHYHESKE